ncbi:aromatic amino acid transporter [Myroides guanonis]|uniref:Tyrosine-specific transport protein n=1 Tax=Myroides guanonis TaxID=1150112 RepID=A0A1I3MU87_9FLAO|nr:aromatic amino acid transporter [Myroides guanonis]SFJ00502.1 tyrosine-specific transport protein [Myroides guanonis]
MKNKLLGSILIIAGSCIGGGMLAMPIIAAGVGFIGIASLLILIWIAMCGSALLMVRVYEFNNQEDGFNSLTQKYLGSFGNRIAGFSLLFLIYGLTAAYMSGGGSIVSNFLETIFGLSINPQLSVLLFSVIFGGIVSISTQWIDGATRALFIIKLVFLALLILAFIPFIKGENLLNMPLEKGLIITSIPIIFTSFGFHGSIPSIVLYLGGNQKKIRLAFIWGSLLPLIIYLLWQFAVLGSLEQNTFMVFLKDDAGLDGLINSIREMAHNPKINLFFSIFAATALGTSFLGVSVGLLDYYRDLLKEGKLLSLRLKASLLTFVPPLLFALFYPKGFLLALSYAALAGVILALVIPALLYYKAMRIHKLKIGILQYSLLLLIGILSLSVFVAHFYELIIS